MNTKQLSRIRLVATDLDGTLLNSEHRVSRENLRAVKDLQDRGVEVVLASGRHYNSMKRIAEQIPGIRWIVSAQGGEVASLDRNTVLFRSYLSPVKVMEVAGLCVELGLPVSAYTPEGVVSTSAKSDKILSLFQEDSGRYIQADALTSEKVFKIVVVGDTVKIASLAGNPFVKNLGIQSLQTHENIFEFMPLDASKGAALDKLALHLGIRPNEVAVFGDGENDVSMFDWAGISVAMPQSWPLAHARAKYIGPDSPQAVAFSCAVNKLLVGAGVC